MEDPNALFTAAASGDMGFLDEALAQHGTNSSYFLCLEKDRGYNFLGHAMVNGQDTFISEALHKLPVVVSLALICQRTEYSRNLLHVAVAHGKMSVVILLVNFYKGNHDKMMSSLSGTQVEEGLARDLRQLPWLAQDGLGFTPMYLAFMSRKEEIVLYLASLDESLHRMPDNMGYSPIYTAVTFGCEQYVENVLSSGVPYNVGDRNSSNPLHETSKSSGIDEKLTFDSRKN